MTTRNPASNLAYNVIGGMSGTSLDGLDVAWCLFRIDGGNWSFSIEKAITVPYSKAWKEKLATARKLEETELAQLDQEFGVFIGDQMATCIQQWKMIPDLICSHGHTVKHNPDEGYSVQIGSGQKITEITGTPVVADFRQADVNLGGQGAPLVPVGDLFLFPNYPCCLNFGGIANVSIKDNLGISAFDIVPCNLIFNHFAEMSGMAYDEDGILGRKGNVQPGLLKKLNSLEYYTRSAPKSLDAEFTSQILTLCSDSNFSRSDQLRTCYEHLTDQIAICIPKGSVSLVTGGGAHNDFLIELLRAKGLDIVIPDKNIIDYKEAMIFGFLGLRNLRDEVNCLSSVTGAARDHITGLRFGF